MNECQIINRLIQQELDSTLTSGEQEQLILHIADCADCAEYRVQMLELEDKLASIATTGAHTNLTEPNLLAEIIPDIEKIAKKRRESLEEQLSTEKIEKNIGWWGRFIGLDWARRYGVAVAVILIMVPVGIGISYNLNQEAGEDALLNSYAEGQRAGENLIEPAIDFRDNDQISESSKYRVQIFANELVVYSSGLEVFRTDSWLDGVRVDYQLLDGDILVYKLYSAEGDNLVNYQVNLLTQEVEQLEKSEIELE